MIDKIVFFNEDNVNIFTDASVKNHGQVTESVAGACIIDSRGNYTLRHTRLLPSTNNEGEIYAIYMGLQLIYEYMMTYPDRKYTFNLFSDSKISIYGLREWYSSWIKNSEDKDVFTSSSGEPVKNQEIFIRCMDMIINLNIKVNFYHVRGHMKDSRSYNKFAEDFKTSNRLSSLPTRELVKELSYWNDIVDETSRLSLLPSAYGKSIPTIMGSHKKDSLSEFMGVGIRKEYLFTHNKNLLSKEKKRYTSLIKLPNI